MCKRKSNELEGSTDTFPANEIRKQAESGSLHDLNVTRRNQLRSRAGSDSTKADQMAKAFLEVHAVRKFVPTMQKKIQGKVNEYKTKANKLRRQEQGGTRLTITQQFQKDFYKKRQEDLLVPLGRLIDKLNEASDYDTNSDHVDDIEKAVKNWERDLLWAVTSPDNTKKRKKVDDGESSKPTKPSQTLITFLDQQYEDGSAHGRKRKSNDTEEHSDCELPPAKKQVRASDIGPEISAKVRLEGPAWYPNKCLDPRRLVQLNTSTDDDKDPHTLQCSSIWESPPKPAKVHQSKLRSAVKARQQQIKARKPFGTRGVMVNDDAVQNSEMSTAKIASDATPESDDPTAVAVPQPHEKRCVYGRTPAIATQEVTSSNVSYPTVGTIRQPLNRRWTCERTPLHQPHT